MGIKHFFPQLQIILFNFSRYAQQAKTPGSLLNIPILKKKKRKKEPILPPPAPPPPPPRPHAPSHPAPAPAHPPAVFVFFALSLKTQRVCAGTIGNYSLRVNVESGGKGAQLSEK